MDSESGEVVRLFNPRKDDWRKHFLWNGPTLKGRTPVGLATIHVLKINDPDYVEVRMSLLFEGLFPRIQ